MTDDDYCIYCHCDTGQTGSPLAEPEAEAEPEADVEEETDLFLKTVAKTLWGLLCVLDNVVI